MATYVNPRCRIRQPSCYSRQINKLVNLYQLNDVDLSYSNNNNSDAVTLQSEALGMA